MCGSFGVAFGVQILRDNIWEYVDHCRSRSKTIENPFSLSPLSPFAMPEMVCMNINLSTIPNRRSIIGFTTKDTKLSYQILSQPHNSTLRFCSHATGHGKLPVPTMQLPGVSKGNRSLPPAGGKNKSWAVDVWNVSSFNE